MSKKQIIVIILIAAIAVFFVVRIVRNALTSEETKIKKLIRELAADFEDKKFKKIFEYVTEDYTDDGGNTKEKLKEDAKLVIAVTKEIDVTIRNLRVVVSADKKTAKAGFTAKVRMSTKFGDIEPLKETAAGEQLIFYLRREGGKWMLYKSNLRKYSTAF